MNCSKVIISGVMLLMLVALLTSCSVDQKDICEFVLRGEWEKVISSVEKDTHLLENPINKVLLASAYNVEGEYNLSKPLLQLLGSNEVNDSWIAWVDSMSSAHPNNYVIAFLSAEMAHRSKNYDDALERYSESILLDNKFPMAYLRRGMTYVELEQYEEALEDINEIIAQDDQNAYALYALGYLHSEKKQYELSITSYTKAIEADSSFAEVYFRRGVSYGGLSNWEEASRDFTVALELIPEFAEVLNNRAFSYHHLGDDDKAITDINTAIELKPFEVAYYNNKASFQAMSEKGYDALMTCYQAIHELPGVDSSSLASIRSLRDRIPFSLPSTGENDELAKELSGDTKITYPTSIDASGSQRTMEIGGIFVFVPTDDGGGFSVEGTIKSLAESFEKTAHLTSWTFFHSDSTKENIAGYGYCATSGEILLPLGAFQSDGTITEFVENHFELETVGAHHVLVKLDSVRNHSLCLGVNSWGGNYLTHTNPGTRITCDSLEFVRRVDGWYFKDKFFCN